MTATEQTLSLLDETGYQINAVFSQWPEGQWDARISEVAFSGRESLSHLIECNHAFLAGAKGETWQWGSYQAPTDDPAELVALLHSTRAEAREVVAGTEDPKTLGLAGSYIILHEAYHVGQLVSLRLHLGDFDAYSIYK